MRAIAIVLALLHSGCTLFFPSEGSASDPKDIPNSYIFSYTGTVNNTADSYYRITDLLPDIAYAISVENIGEGDVSLVYHGSDSTFQSEVCTTPIPDNPDDLYGNWGCWFIPKDSQIFVHVSTTSPGLAFKMYMWEGSYNNDPLHPIHVNYSTLPAAGTVSQYDSENDLYYRVFGLSPLSQYQVHVFNLDNDTDLHTGDCQSKQTLLTNESCNIQTSDNQTTIDIRIEGMYATAPASFQLSMKPSPVADGSLVTPKALSLAPAGIIAGQVSAAPGISYYSISGLTVGSPYTISLKNITSDVNLRFSGSDQTFAAAVCQSANLKTANEACTAIAMAAVEYFEVVSANSGGAYYDIEIK